jgi:two-component system, NarL family, response regulator LiaR
MPNFTISILEDSKPFAQLLAKTISEQANFSVLNIAHTASDAIKLFVQNPTDINIIDISLPDGSGIDVIKSLKPQLPEAKFLICTSFDDDDKVFSAITSGANGYLVKTDSNFDVLKSINELLQGEAPMSSGIASKIINFFYQQTKQNTNLVELLSPKESAVLQQLSEGLLYKEIADKQGVSIDTIKKHCGSIYKKFHVSNRTEAINKFLGR